MTSYDTWLYLVVVVIVVLSSPTLSQDVGHRRDPTPIIYPGQVNIALLANIHEAPAPNSTSGCGKLRQDAVQKAMASVWAAHQVNFRKDDSHELNIGIYIFDTCGRETVAQRQVYRLLGHVGHVQTTSCSDKRIPPLFAVITEGDSESLRLPSKLFDAFGVPVVATSGPTIPEPMPNMGNYLTTAPTTRTLARAAVTVLRQLHLLEVAVIAEDNSPGNLFVEFSREAQVSGMQALPVDHPSIVGDPDNFLASLQVVSEYGRSRLKAVVFLVNSEQALDLLRSVDSSNFPQMPWVLVTQADLAPIILKSFKRHQLRRLQQVLLLSPETSDLPEFQDYFKQLLQEDTIKYHPLLVEFAKSIAAKNETEDNASRQWRRTSRRLRFRQGTPNPNVTTTSSDIETVAMTAGTVTETPHTNVDALPSYPEADVSPVVKAVWTLAASLKAVQKKSCRRGTDCLLYLRRSLSSYSLKAAKSLDYTLDSNSGSAHLEGTRLSFSEEGTLNSVRFSLKGFTFRGDMQEVGWYSDETGLTLDHDVLSPFNGFVFDGEEPQVTKRTTQIPELLPQFEFQPEKVSPTPTTNPPSTTEGNVTSVNAEQYSEQPVELESEVSNTLPLEDGDYISWKILGDVSREILTTSEPSTVVSADTEPSLSTAENVFLRPIEGDIEENNNHVFDESLPVLSQTTANRTSNKDVTHPLLGPTYRTEHHSSSSNLRSISLTSHHEPRVNNAFRPAKQDISSIQLPEVFGSKSPPLARSVDRPSSGVVPSSSTEDVKVISSSRNLHISVWLARPWALVILGFCGFGILVTLYVLVFLMVKACEGSLKKTNTSVAVAQLIALLCLYVAAALFTWKPSSLLCGLQRLVPNVSYAFCFGCLLLKGMHLKAQNSLGLGGSVNKCNQVLTLLFIVGVQVALEIQWWFVRPPAVISETMECTVTKEEIMQSQGYVSFLLLLGVVVAVSTRKIPYNCQEVRSLIGSTLTCLIVFLSWDVACWLLPDSNSRNIAAPSALIITAIVVLAGIFGPQLFAIHKYGGFPHKPLSYADSLSTVFTMFKDLDNSSNSGTTGRGKKTAKTLETPFGNEVGEGTRNPLYSDYQSAYP